MNIVDHGDGTTLFYRAFSNDIIPIIISYSSGVLVNKSYNSCTNIDKAKEFVSNECCILMFTIPSDIKYHKFNDQTEGEVLVERNTQFIIKENNSTHPIYNAILTKWEHPTITENTSNVRDISKALANECTQLGRDAFYEKRKAYYMEDDDEESAEFLADAEEYCK